MEKDPGLVKNLKVFDRINREVNVKQRKKSKFRVVLASLVLSVTLVLAGCSGYNESQQRIYDAGQQVSQEVIVESSEQSVEETKEVEIGISELNSVDLQYYDYILNQAVTFSDLNATSVQNAVNSINPIYPFTNISNVELAYDNYQQIPPHSNYEISQKIVKGELTAQELYNIVMQNNINYKTKNPYSINGFLEDDYVMSICEVICDTLKNEIPKLKSTDKYDDITYEILNLSILKSATMANASVTDDSCLVVSPTQISNYATLNNIDADLAFKKVITHEVQHLLQKISLEARKDLNIDRGYGFMYSFEDVKVNSMYWNWMIESSAEKLAARYYNIKPMSYTYMINYLNTLILSNSFNDNMRVDDIPRLTQQSDINELFNLFGCKTYESKIEFLNMMYAIEIIQFEPEDFFGAYEAQSGKTLEYDEISQLKVELKNSICQTFTKYFYTSISTRLQSTSMTAEDIYKVISLFEADLNFHILYDDEYWYDTIQEFMESYIYIQDEFFEQLSNQLGISVDEVRSGYEAYNAEVKSARKSVLYDTVTPGTDMSIQAFDTEKNEFLNTVFTNISNKKTNTISQIYGEYNKNLQK